MGDESEMTTGRRMEADASPLTDRGSCRRRSRMATGDEISHLLQRPERRSLEGSWQ